MKNILLYLTLIILPATLFFIEMYFRFLRGEYFLFAGYDGPYGYLLSALNIAQMKMPGFAQHPGIVPQLIMAAVIKLSFLFKGIESNLVLDTIYRPEFYLARINFAFTAITAVSLFILGAVTFKKIGNIFAALFIQLTPFVSIIIVYQLTQNVVETSLMIFILLLLSVSISLIYDNEITKKKNILYALLFGIICGLAMASKISFLPILIIPILLIKKVLYKAFFILITLFVFLLLLFSTMPDISIFWMLAVRNITNTGNYGSGPSNFINVSEIIPVFQFIINEFFSFLVIYLLAILILILQFVPRFKNQIRSNKFFLLLNGAVIVQSAFIIILIKSPLAYYLMPGLLFSIMGLFAINSIVSDLFPKFYKVSNYLYIYIFFILFTIPNVVASKSFILSNKNRKDESYKISNYLQKNYKESIIVATDFCTSMPTAFFEGLYYAGEQKNKYYEILTKKYPKFVFYERWAKKFVYLDKNPDLKKELINSDSFVYQSFNEASFIDFKGKLIELTKKPNTTFKEVFSTNLGEKLYLVTLKN